MTNHDPRDLEWQRRYEQNDTPWDKGEPAPPLMSYLKQSAISGRVLVPGCGKGHEVRALARQPNCSAVGLDLSPLAIEEAQRLAAQAGAGAGASFIVGDFFHLPSEINGTFDWLVEHTCFCAIEPRQRADYVLAATSALRAGGKIFGIFYLNPGTESGPPFAVSREELSGLFEPHFTLLEQWTPQESFPGREGREWVGIWQKR
jgi:SAM-dependent methyltransferase